MQMKSMLERVWLGFAAAALAVPNVAAQVDSGESLPDVTRAFALNDARIVQAPGVVLERATIVIRNGLITAVGPDAPIPFDAERIDADSLTVYAGFIDGLSHAGVPEPKEEPNSERPDNPGNPPDEDAGIQPDRDVRTLVDGKNKRIKDLRNIGFTAAHVVPRGRMLPGTGAVILLGDGDGPDLVVKGNVSAYAQLAPARRMYPGTDMAVIAKMRQLHREAARRQHIERLYTSDPTGIERPRYDPVHYAMFPVLNNERPVFFHTDDALDVHRVLALQEELGFPIVVVGLEQGFETLDKLTSAGHPLFLTLDLPKEPDPKDKPSPPSPTQTTDAPEALPEIPAMVHNQDFRTVSFEDVEAEKENLEARRMDDYKRHASNASVLHESGLTFGFSSRGVKPSDISNNIQTMIEHGLSENAALAALTTEAADILGLSAMMGTVEVGKMANLVVSDGPVFDDETTLRFVFVDGRKYDIEEAKADSATSSTGAAGIWSFVVSTPDGEISGTVTLEEDGGEWSGSLSHEMASDVRVLSNVDVDGNEVSFSFTEDGIGNVSVTLTMDGDTFSGEMSSSELGVVTLQGSRTPQL